MNIVSITSSFFPAIGGKEIVLHNLLTEFEKYEDIKSRLLRFGGVKFRVKHSFPYTYHIYPQLFKKFQLNIAVGLFIEKLVFGIDVIHLHGIYPLGSYLIDNKQRLNYNLIITPHGEDIQKIPALHYGVRLRPNTEEEIINILENADAITAISRIIEKDIKSLCRRTPELIPNGVATTRILQSAPTYQKTIAKKKLNIRKNAKTILAVGRNHPKKGFDVLIRAMALVTQQESTARLIIVGGGCKSLLPLINSLRLQNNVILTGRIPKKSELDPLTFETPNDELIEYYHLCDIYVMSSFIESFGVVTIEAMAAGKPVIATDLDGGDASGSVIDGYNGFLVQPGNSEQMADRIIMLSRNDSLRWAMGNNSRKTAQAFDWSKISRKYIQLYKNICGPLG